MLVVGDVYQFRWPETGIEMTLERLTEHRDGIIAEITVAVTIGETPGLLHYARLNLLSTSTRAQLQKTLSGRMDSVAWGTALEQVCLMTVARYRTGEPVVDLREVDLEQANRWRVRPFIEDDAATIIFGDGGVGKSLFAMAIAVTMASGVSVLGELIGERGPVLYLDWEADAQTHAERLAALCFGAHLFDPPPVHYRRMVASLAESAPLIRKDVAQLGAQLVIVDSLGAAKSDEPEGAQASISLFRAGRSFGVPWLGIDHIAKASAGSLSKPGSRPFGSTYTHNLARLTWSLEQADEQLPDGYELAVTNQKRNNGKLLGRRGYRVTVRTSTDGERLTGAQFSAIDVRSTVGLMKTLPLADRIYADLLRHPLSNAELYDEFPDEPKATIRARLKDLRDRGRVIQVAHERWGVVANG